MKPVENKLKSSPSVKVSEEYIPALLRKWCGTLCEVGKVLKLEKIHQGFLEFVVYHTEERQKIKCKTR